MWMEVEVRVTSNLTIDLPSRVIGDKHAVESRHRLESNHQSPIGTNLHWSGVESSFFGKFKNLEHLEKLTRKLRFWRCANSLGPHLGRVVNERQSQVSTQIIVAPWDTCWRVGDVGDVEWDLKCHIRVDHVQHLSISRNLAAARLLQLRHAEPVLKLPDARFQVQVSIELQCSLAAHITRVLVRHHVGIGACLNEWNSWVLHLISKFLIITFFNLI